MENCLDLSGGDREMEAVPYHSVINRARSWPAWLVDEKPKVSEPSRPSSWVEKSEVFISWSDDHSGEDTSSVQINCSVSGKSSNW